MTVRELVKVIDENAFIAVGAIDNKRISYSGRAKNFKSFLADSEVISVSPARSESSATIIYVK